MPVLSPFGDAFAVICLVAIIPWILGIPGNAGEAGKETDYARGWKMGLSVLLVYPIVRAVAVAAVWGGRSLANAQTQSQIENFIANLSALAFVLALLRLGWALRVLSGD